MTMKPWLMAMVGALLMTGCAGSPRKTLLERTSSYVVYDLPAQQVMDAAEKVLGARGYALLPSTDPLFLHTPWKVTGNCDVWSGPSWSASTPTSPCASSSRSTLTSPSPPPRTTGESAG